MVKERKWNKPIINFINGIAILLPIVVTVALVKFLVVQVNNLVLNPIIKSLTLVTGEMQRVYLAKSLIFFIVIFAVMVIGWAAKILFINRAFSSGERVLLRVPFLGRIYNAAKQIFAAFIGHGKTIFKQVVLVEYPSKGLYALGFTTGITKGEIRDAMAGNGINVFIPTTPNPTSGMFIVVPKESIRFLKMSVEEGMKMIVSGGAVSPDFQEPLLKE
ncbi:MAG: DUF502 domain-containing protein [Candidatus Omnitrophota bacterium]